MSTYKQYAIDSIQDTLYISPDTFNKRYTQIQADLNDLSARVAGISDKSALVQSGCSFDSDVTTGDVVYFDSAESKFKKAVAGIKSIPGKSGESLLTASSRVLGIVVDKLNGVLLTQGYWEAGWILSTICDTTAVAGIYYLSSSQSGKVTRDPSNAMRQPVLSYYGDGKFSFIVHYLAHDNHNHQSTKITTWLLGQYVISGKTYKYKHSFDSTLYGFGQETTAVFNNGLLNTTDYYISDSTVYADTSSSPLSTVLFNNYPFAYGDSVVRSITSSDLSVAITTHNGFVDITRSTYEYSDSYINGYAISKISGDIQYKTPVVTSLLGGTGIEVSKDSSGKYTIKSTDNFNNYIQAYDVLNNGTQLAADDMMTYLMFPKGIATNAVLHMKYNTQSSNSYKVYVWCIYKSVGSSSNSINVTYYWLKRPTLTLSVSITPESLGSLQLILASTQSNILALVQGGTGVTLDSQRTDGTIMVKLLSTPTNTLSLYGYGIIIKDAL